MNVGPQTAKNWTGVLFQTSANYAFYFIATLRRRRSANGTQPNFANGGQ